MRLFFTALASLLLVQAAAAQVSAVKSVYVMPMTGGLDQYLALQLSGAVLIVTDPQKADAVLTDRVGERFEERWHDLFGTKEEKAKSDADATFARVGMSGNSGRGVFFLVDRATRGVLWSTFALPKSSTPHELNRTAEIIAERFTKTLKGK